MKILLVDDDEGFRSALAENLRDDGHEVLEYAAASVLPPLGRFNEVNVAIADYDLPREDGITFADRFHASHPQIPVVIVTAFSTPHLDASIARRDYLTILRKPFQYETLCDLLQRIAAR